MSLYVNFLSAMSKTFSTSLWSSSRTSSCAIDLPSGDKTYPSEGSSLTSLRSSAFNGNAFQRLVLSNLDKIDPLAVGRTLRMAFVAPGGQLHGSVPEAPAFQRLTAFPAGVLIKR